MRKKLVLLFVAVLLILPTLILPISALKLTYSPTDAYKSSIFYERLVNLKLTGDQRRDILNVAISQLGYHEGNSRSEFHGMNYLGSQNYVEYNYANKNTLDAGGSYYWCASFVTFCARQAGISTSTVINSVSCDNFVVNFKSQGRYKTRASGYTPVAGDFIFFLDSGANRTYASHIGIVVGVSGGKVYTIEGNTSRDMVNYRSYDLGNSRIVGYAVPAYTGTTGNYGDFELKNGYVEIGIYKVTSDTLNLRSSPTTSSSIVHTVKKSTELYISEASGDWGKTVYNGKTVWISLHYVTPKDVADYTITYRVGNDKVDSQTARAGSTAKILPLDEIPIGYEFLGWSRKQSSSSAELSPSDSLTVTGNVTLYAVLKAKPITVSFYDWDGTLIGKTVYKYGDTVLEPSAPERASDEKFDYVFVGWDKSFISTARADRSYTAVYRAVEKTLPPSSSNNNTSQENDGDIPNDTTVESPSPENGSPELPNEAPITESQSKPMPAKSSIAAFLVLIIATATLFIVKRKF
ncbi:MAG: InlB B-repeat-containing protein [Clostridia bacterium]|nr:InlB B-repeat-containing protein [Clostridia bacterium]